MFCSWGWYPDWQHSSLLLHNRCLSDAEHGNNDLLRRDVEFVSVP